MRKVDIAHSGQTVPEAIEQLRDEIKHAHRAGDRTLLVVHGFGASGVGGAIKAAMAAELPRLARTYAFKAYGHADRGRMPREQAVDARGLNPGSTLLVFREVGREDRSERDFRPNFRNLRSKVRVASRASASSQLVAGCRHLKRQLVSRGPEGRSYKCRLCGKTFLVPSQG
jgi:hypothetical protein